MNATVFTSMLSKEKNKLQLNIFKLFIEPYVQ